jgi:integrase/recombinase XerD
MKRSPKSSGVWTPDSERTYTRKRIDRADSRNRGSLRAFAEWLRSSRGLQPGSVTVRMGSACTFVDAVAAQSGRSCAMAFRLLTCVEIEDFFVDYAKKQGKAGLRSMQAAMRLFLRFAASRGWVGPELVQAVPSQRSYRLSHLPRGVSDAHLLKLLESRWESGQSGRRDRVIVYLLATYGVRRGQLSALKLTDIDWHAKTIRFAAHKGGKEIRHGLTDACAQVLAEYLRRERQPSESEFVFLRGRRPYVRLSPAAISEVVRAWTVRCGIAPCYPHAFRHAFASRLLRARQPAKTISDLLGHRSLDAVGIYAKVDHARLLEAAVEWPEVSS